MPSSPSGRFPPGGVVGVTQVLGCASCNRAPLPAERTVVMRTWAGRTAPSRTVFPAATTTPTDAGRYRSRCRALHRAHCSALPSRRTGLGLPDDYYTATRATSPTDLAVTFEHMTVAPSEKLAFTFDALETLDGFGPRHPIVLVFSNALRASSLPPVGQDEASWSDSVLLVELGSPASRLIPFAWRLVEESDANPQTTLVLRPLLPLSAKTRYGVVVTNRVADVDGACVARSPRCGSS